MYFGAQNTCLRETQWVSVSKLYLISHIDMHCGNEILITTHAWCGFFVAPQYLQSASAVSTHVWCIIHLHCMKRAMCVTSKANPHVRFWCKSLAVHRRMCMWASTTSMQCLHNPPWWGRESQPSHRNVWSTRGKCAFLSSSFPHRRRLHGESKQSQMQAFVRFSTLTGLATHTNSFLCSICSKMRS